MDLHINIDGNVLTIIGAIIMICVFVDYMVNFKKPAPTRDDHHTRADEAGS